MAVVIPSRNHDEMETSEAIKIDKEKSSEEESSDSLEWSTKAYYKNAEQIPLLFGVTRIAILRC